MQELRNYNRNNESYGLIISIIIFIIQTFGFYVRRHD